MAKEFRTELAAPNGSSEDPAYTFYMDLDTGMFRSGSDVLGLSAGGNVNLYVLTNEVRVYNGFRVISGDATFEQDASHRHGTSRRTSMMDLEVLAWMNNG